MTLSGKILHPNFEPDILECEVKWALGSITINKTSGGDRISAKLFQILKDDAVKVLHSICQQIWKTQQWPQDWKRSWRSFLYSSSLYSCHLFLISSASVRSIAFLSFIAPIFSMKYYLGVSNFLDRISSLSHSVVFLYFFTLMTEEHFLIFPCYLHLFCHTSLDYIYWIKIT